MFRAIAVSHWGATVTELRRSRVKTSSRFPNRTATSKLRDHWYLHKSDGATDQHGNWHSCSHSFTMAIRPAGIASTEMASKKVAFIAPREESRARETGAKVSTTRSSYQMLWPEPTEACNDVSRLCFGVRSNFARLTSRGAMKATLEESNSQTKLLGTTT